MPGSNRRPPACKAGALPTELTPRSPHSSGIAGSPRLRENGLWLQKRPPWLHLAFEMRHTVGGTCECRRTERHRALIEEAVEAAREAVRLCSEDERLATRNDSANISASCPLMSPRMFSASFPVASRSSTVQRGRQSVRLWRRWSRATSGRLARRAGSIAGTSLLDSVSTRAADPADESWETSDFDLLTLANDTYALRYALRQGGRRTRRVTIWRRGEGQWEVLYHQGTVVTDDA